MPLLSPSPLPASLLSPCRLFAALLSSGLFSCATVFCLSGEGQAGLVSFCGVEKISWQRLAGADAEVFQQFHLADEIAAAFAQLLHGVRVAGVGAAQAPAYGFKVADEVDELVVELGAAVHHVL